MANEREQALTERDFLVNNYLRGLLENAPVGAKYAKALREIKGLLSQTLSYYARPKEDTLTENEQERLKIGAVGFVGWLVLYLLFPGSGFLLHTIALIVLVSMFYSTTKNALWTVVPLTLHFSSWFVGFVGKMDKNPTLTENSNRFMVWAVFIILLLYMRDTVRSLASKKALVQKQNRLEAKLRQRQKELTELLPAIKAELQEIQDGWFEENQHLLQPEDQEAYRQQRENFPPAFWWQLSLESLKPFAMQIFRDGRYDIWETRLVKRQEGKEFRATDEYSPLFLPLSGEHKAIMKTFRQELQCEVYDAISQCVSLDGTVGRTVQYQTCKHNALERVSVDLSVMGLAKSIDDAYQQGEIAEQDYKSLSNEMFWLGVMAEDYKGEQETKEYVEYVPVRTHTNLWTGQFMVMQGSDGKGRSYRALRQYYCQLPHLIKNIKALKELPIDLIDYDPFGCNPYFLACFYAVFPYCA